MERGGRKQLQCVSIGVNCWRYKKVAAWQSASWGLGGEIGTTESIQHDCKVECIMLPTQSIQHDCKVECIMLPTVSIQHDCRVECIMLPTESIQHDCRVECIMLGVTGPTESEYTA